MISGAQVRKGRILLGWTPRDLARRAHVGVFTVNQIELIAGPSRHPGLATIEAALKAEGVVARRALATSEKAGVNRDKATNRGAVQTRPAGPGSLDQSRPSASQTW